MKIRSDVRDTCNVVWGLLFILLHCIGLSIFVTASNNYNYVNVITLINVDFKLFNAALIIKAALNNLKSTFSMLSVFCIVGRSDC